MFNNIDNTNYKTQLPARAHLCNPKGLRSAWVSPLHPLLRKLENYCSNNFLNSSHITLGAM